MDESGSADPIARKFPPPTEHSDAYPTVNDELKTESQTTVPVRSIFESTSFPPELPAEIKYPSPATRDVKTPWFSDLYSNFLLLFLSVKRRYCFPSISPQDTKPESPIVLTKTAFPDPYDFSHTMFSVFFLQLTRERGRIRKISIFFIL